MGTSSSYLCLVLQGFLYGSYFGSQSCQVQLIWPVFGKPGEPEFLDAVIVSTLSEQFLCISTNDDTCGGQKSSNYARVCRNYDGSLNPGLTWLAKHWPNQLIQTGLLAKTRAFARILVRLDTDCWRRSPFKWSHFFYPEHSVKQ